MYNTVISNNNTTFLYYVYVKKTKYFYSQLGDFVLLCWPRWWVIFKIIINVETSLITMVYIITVCNMCIVDRRVKLLDLWVHVCLPAGGTQESNRVSYYNVITNRYDDRHNDGSAAGCKHFVKMYVPAVLSLLKDFYRNIVLRKFADIHTFKVKPLNDSLMFIS